jgi:RNA polymerase sigma-70 factor (ECF subfamily)
MDDGNSSKTEWIVSVLARYEGPLTRYAARITGDIERARDVVQDTFLRLCSEKEARVRGRVGAWLFTVCRNRALDVRRKESDMTALDKIQEDSRSGEDPDPAACLEQKEALGQILTALETLPENQQEVLRLKFQNGFSYQEISRITSLSVSNVGFLIHTGLKTIRQQFNAKRLLTRKP